MIRIDALYCQETYLGSMEGPYSREILLADIRLEAEKIWGSRKIFTIEPPRLKDAPRLPRYVYAAWLSGPVVKEGDGSELVLIWYKDEGPEKGFDIKSLIAENFKWEEQAEDFYY